MLELTPHEVIIRHVKETPTGWRVWQHCLLSVLVLVWLSTVHWGKKRKTYRLCIPMQRQQKKKNKRKGSDAFKTTTTNDDLPSGCVCAITSFEGFVRSQPVFRSVVMCFVPSSRVLLFSWFAKILLISRLGWKKMAANGVFSPQLSWSRALAPYILSSVVGFCHTCRRFHPNFYVQIEFFFFLFLWHNCNPL